jgi:hypothetical protein
MIRFKRVTFSWLSPLIGVHVGRNPVSGQRFMHVAPLPFVGLDFEFWPYVNDEAIAKLGGYDD